MDGEKLPVTKTMNFFMLPGDLILHCLARVSRFCYSTLSLASKRFRSFIDSIELYETRTLLSCTESCLYVFIRFPRDYNPTRRFTIRQRPIQIRNPNPSLNSKPIPRSGWSGLVTRKKKEISTDNLMISIPTRNTFDMCRWNLIVVGYKIYKIGGRIDNLPSSEVFFMDCRSHTWCETSSMSVARPNPCVSVLDGKIYVVDKSGDLNPPTLIKCFDPKSHIWEHVPSPNVEIGMTSIFKSLAIKGNFCMFGNKSVVYKPKENKWDELGLMDEIPSLWRHNYACVIDNVLYYYGMYSKNFEWYDFEGRCWRILKGLENMPKLPMYDDCVKLVDYGGKIAVLWEKYEREKEIWCAEISLERRNKQEIYGKVEWCDFVLTIPNSCFVLKLLAVTF